MNPLVEFCVSNLANGSQETFEVLEKDPNIDVLEYGCLSYCTRCSDTLYALVNGEMVEAETPEELTKRIYQFIEENPLF
ncbi:YuzB family protein [Rummeliibacillus pycnus]|uniref:YuzB family protein n=1 Tax=Rummeliibacillus pycnus TaxID=101070 RepID=UPI0037C610C0